MKRTILAECLLIVALVAVAVHFASIGVNLRRRGFTLTEIAMVTALPIGLDIVLCPRGDRSIAASAGGPRFRIGSGPVVRVQRRWSLTSLHTVAACGTRQGDLRHDPSQRDWPPPSEPWGGRCCFGGFRCAISKDARTGMASYPPDGPGTPDRRSRRRPRRARPLEQRSACWPAVPWLLSVTLVSVLTASSCPPGCVAEW